MDTFPSQLTARQQRMLKQAEDFLGNVQVELYQADASLPAEKRTDNWRKLYSIRVELGQECFRLNGNRDIL